MIVGGRQIREKMFRAYTNAKLVASWAIPYPTRLPPTATREGSKGRWCGMGNGHGLAWHKWAYYLNTLTVLCGRMKMDENGWYDRRPPSLSNPFAARWVLLISLGNYGSSRA